MVYGRTLEQGTAGTASRREEFRRISVRWHRFFGFGAADARTGRLKRKAEGFEVAREEAKKRRMGRLRDVDLGGRLKQMLGDDKKFRGRQEEVIKAIVRGYSPIVQVAGTGEGKSLSFMLPAFCSREGVTIVVVPLVALRADMQRRLEEISIDAHMWQGRGGKRAASIVLVTPESVVTKGFREFINRLRGRQQLDRIVVDECHTVLDSTEEFRPRMRELGQVLGDIGVQMVFLTATLGPGDEEEFCRLMGIRRKEAVIFRSATTRRNIQYQVVEERGGAKARGKGVEDKVVLEARRMEKDNASGKVVVYCRRIEQAKELAERLECPVFFSKVDGAVGKAQRLKGWMETGRLIVATNAMGVGLDVPDIRGVIHAGAPFRLRDYAQESGRGGRDRELSEAVIARGREEVERYMAEFMEEGVCRRVVLDGVMDGRADRVWCEEGEVRCDTCKLREELEIMAEEEEEEGNLGVEENEIEMRAGFTVVGKAAREGMEVAELRRQLEGWVELCVVCWLAEAEETGHKFDQCPAKGRVWHDVRRKAEQFKKELFGARRLERFSGCFHCGIPQEWCDSWEAEGNDGGRYKRVGNWCQYKGLLETVIMGILVAGCKGKALVKETMKKDGVDLNGDEKMYRWFGRKIRWGGLETNNMCRVFYMLNKMAEEDEE